MLGDKKPKPPIDLRRGLAIGRRTAQVVNRVNRQSNQGKMPEWKAQQIYDRNKDIAENWTKSQIKNMGNLTPASREINASMNATRKAQSSQMAQAFRNALGFSSARADKTRTRR